LYGKGKNLVSRDWHIDDYIERLLPDKNSSLAAQFEVKSNPKRHLTKKDITDDLLEGCYVLLADIISRHGNAYFPIFERLHIEIETREKQKEMLIKAKNISRGKPKL